MTTTKNQETQVFEWDDGEYTEGIGTITPRPYEKQEPSNKNRPAYKKAKKSKQTQVEQKYFVWIELEDETQRTIIQATGLEPTVKGPTKLTAMKYIPGRPSIATPKIPQIPSRPIVKEKQRDNNNNNNAKRPR